MFELCVIVCVTQPYTSTPIVATDPTPFAAQVQAANRAAPVPKQPLFAETPKRSMTNGASAPPVYYPPETDEMFAKTSPEAPLLMVTHFHAQKNVLFSH